KPGCHCHDQGEQEIGGAKHQRGTRSNEWHRLRRSTERKPGPECEQKLPCEWIEIPVANWKRRKVPAEVPGHHIEQRRSGQCHIGSAQHQPQERWEDAHQHDVKRQHIHVHRLEAKYQPLEQELRRICQEAPYVNSSVKLELPYLCATY